MNSKGQAKPATTFYCWLSVSFLFLVSFVGLSTFGHKSMKQKIIAILKKYRIQLGILLLFVVYMSFIDEYNWLRIHRDKGKLENLQEERDYLLKKIEEDRTQLHTLQTDTEALEKYAREQYLLKKENEEVFIIQEDK